MCLKSWLFSPGTQPEPLKSSLKLMLPPPILEHGSPTRPAIPSKPAGQELTPSIFTILMVDIATGMCSQRFKSLLVFLQLSYPRAFSERSNWGSSNVCFASVRTETRVLVLRGLLQFRARRTRCSVSLVRTERLGCYPRQPSRARCFAALWLMSHLQCSTGQGWANLRFNLAWIWAIQPAGMCSLWLISCFQVTLASRELVARCQLIVGSGRRRGEGGSICMAAESKPLQCCCIFDIPSTS